MPASKQTAVPASKQQHQLANKQTAIPAISHHSQQTHKQNTSEVQMGLPLTLPKLIYPGLSLNHLLGIAPNGLSHVNRLFVCLFVYVYGWTSQSHSEVL